MVAAKRKNMPSKQLWQTEQGSNQHKLAATNTEGWQPQGFSQRGWRQPTEKGDKQEQGLAVDGKERQSKFYKEWSIVKYTSVNMWEF